jgi:type IV pilus assembly protein PilQ
MKLRSTFQALPVVLLAVFGGCALPRFGGQADSSDSRLQAAREAFEKGNYSSAMIQCVDLARTEPEVPGLLELEREIMARIMEVREQEAAVRTGMTDRRMNLDLERQKSIPQTYGLNLPVKGNTSPLRTPLSAMQKVLQKRVSVALDNVNLNEFVLALGRSENINMVADNNIPADTTLTIHAQDVPLVEILEYVARNLGVTFSVGENIIWVTQAAGPAEGVPLETRMYALRKGISGDEAEAADSRIRIMDALDRFVPKAQGADMLFNSKAHMLIVKNSRENLTKVEDILERLDVCPPQILIEARFISVSVNDLREIGIDWIITGPIAVTTEQVLENGRVVSRNQTQIDPGAAFTAKGFPNEAEGLNFTYRGILTEPAFQAVLHALDLSGKSRTLSVPKVTTVNNRPAFMRIGEDFLYFEEYDTVQTLVSHDDGAAIYQSQLVPRGRPTQRELGIKLNVTPSVGADMRTVELKIVPEISEFVRYEEFLVAAGNSTTTGTTATGSTNSLSLIKLPIFRVSTVETEVITQSGDTVVMGGLSSSTEKKDVSSVPLLSSIPFIGKLFFSRDYVEELRNNLLIFVTATILSDRGVNLIPVADLSREPAAQAP